ncbi:MAG TPA: zf-HC2 domain-containing protein [Longimicrobiaceae bacterium]|nr:zf-HC2 domain-containing protein [Longimicrobiaceae bacterium]
MAMVDCARFLEEYSEFRDSILPAGESREFEAHLIACPSCARYDRVVQRGVCLFRELPELQPSEDFSARLQHRIYNLDEEMRRPGRSFSGIPVSAAVSIAAVLAMAAWLPVLRPDSGVPRLPAVSAQAPQPEVPALSMAGPLLAHAALLHRDMELAVLASRDRHLLFRYNPVAVPLGIPVALQTALND